MNVNEKKEIVKDFGKKIEIQFNRGTSCIINKKNYELSEHFKIHKKTIILEEGC